MNFQREKSWLLGLLAIIAPLPLPFNEVVGWPPVLAFCGAAAVFLLRTDRGDVSVLPYWVMNVLGLLYIPFLVGDLSLLRSGRVLAPLVHLALYAMAVKLFAIRQEKDKWHIFLGLFFLFVASMATSVHPTAVFYLLAFGVLSALTLIRFAGLHSVAANSQATREPRVPLRRFLAGMMLASAVAAIPLFFFLPRLRQPYIYLPASGPGGVVQVSGFSDRLELGMLDRVRLARTVVFRFSYETPPPPATEMRFKVTTYDTYARGGWRREPNRSASLPRGRDGFFHFAPHFPISWMKIWLRPGNDRMILPVETAVVDLPRNGIVLDGAGEARFLAPSPGITEYRVGLTDRPVASGWRRDQSRPSELDASAVTPRMAELASEVMGAGDLPDRIRRLERYLRTEYGYSLDPVNSGSRPIERFLFETKEGHCEYFASAMVLLLRSQGIAARVVTGYLGSDYNPLEEYFIVRQSNAHAWVEAFLPNQAAALGIAGDGGAERGEPRVDGTWMTFDPTPADARPQSGKEGIVTLMSQAYDYLLFRWDRYVLTYGFADQVDVLIGLRNAWLQFWQALKTADDQAGPAEPAPLEASLDSADEPKPDAPREGLLTGKRAVPFLVLLAAAALWFYSRRERFSATLAYRRLRAKAASVEGEEIEAASGPIDLAEKWAKRYPQAEAETRCVVSHYVRESFADEELTAEELDRVREALSSAKKKLLKSA